MSKKRTGKREEKGAAGEAHERPGTNGNDASQAKKKRARRSGHWTPELIDAAFQIQELRERVRSIPYTPGIRGRQDFWTWRCQDGTERKGGSSKYMSLDTYLTGRLETEPDTIKAWCIVWEKRPQKAFTEKGQDSYVFVGRHSRGFILTVYPTRLIDTAQPVYMRHGYATWWSSRIYLDGWAREVDDLAEDEDPPPTVYYVNASGEKVYKTVSYLRAMLQARLTADKWNYDPYNKQFPVKTLPRTDRALYPLSEPDDLDYIG